MAVKLALAGNPNCGKTTLFNALTGSNQYVGNWPGVTVEKKEGRVKGIEREIEVVDLPGIYSLSPYTLEEVVTRDYLIQGEADAIINIVDASNLERNLYLTTQLMELGIPMVVALNMMDIVEKRGDFIDAAKLSRGLGCPVIPVSAAKSQGLGELVTRAISLKPGQLPVQSRFDSATEEALGQIWKTVRSEPGIHGFSPRWLSVKLFERDAELMKHIALNKEAALKVEALVKEVEKQKDDDAESIITNERYAYVSALLTEARYKKSRELISASDRIDSVLTNRWLALPLFFLIMWGIYYVSIQTVGSWTIGWVEDLIRWVSDGARGLLVAWGTSDWLVGLSIDGILGGIGSVLVFVPQLMILFFFLSILEDCGYMARVAFIMDRIFRKFGLSGKSFIPMLIGTGCSVPGITASRTIEQANDRKMTILLTPFIPCGAKLPVFALFVAMVFQNASWVGPSMYLIGMAMVIVSGLILKRTRLFAGKPAPFVLELPEYKMPRLKSVSIHMWEKGKSFVVKAGTVIFAACAVIWFLQSFSPDLIFLASDQIDQSILAGIGMLIAPVFAPLGFGNWAATVAIVTGLVAKEMVVSTLAVISTHAVISFTPVSAYAFMVFILLSAPCFAAISAIRREMGNWKWTWIALFYQTGSAYVLAFLIHQAGSLLMPDAKAIALSGSISETGEGLQTQASILTNPMIYILGGIVLALIIVGITGIVKKSLRPSLPGPDAGI